MSAVKNILVKELTRVFTDKKLVFSLFVMPGLLIMIMYSLMGRLATNMVNDIEKNIPKVYIQNAPEGFDELVSSMGYEAEITPLVLSHNIEDIKADIKSGDVELLVVFEEGFLDKIGAYQNLGDEIPEVKTYYNTVEDYSVAAREKFLNMVLNTYQQQLLAERLGNIEQLQVFYIDKDPQSSIIVDEEKASAKPLSMLLPLLINIMLFSGAMGLGVDAITGEKERGTLSSMLISPIKRSDIVMGKLLSLGILSSLSAVIYTIFTMIGIQRLYGGFEGDADTAMGALGNISFTPIEMIQLLVLLLIVVYLYVSLISLVAVYARTAKEANTYVMPLMIVVMLGSIMTMFSGGTEKGIEYFAIPIYNSAVSLQNLFLGELTMTQFGLTVGTTAFLAAIITVLITKAFNSEKVMFNA